MVGSWEALAAVSCLSLIIFTLASYLQVQSVRALGPGAYGSLSSLRLPVAILASYFVMEEPVRNALEWVGIVVIVAVMTEHLRFKSARER